MPELERYRERFLPTKIEINVDGICEEWEFEKVEESDNTLLIRYKLKERSKYKID